MKKNVEYVQVTKEVVSYEAYDGTVFSTEEQCKRYEETAECAIEAALKNIVVRECSGSTILEDGAPFAYDGCMRAVKISSANDVEILNKWIITVTRGDKSNCITSNSIGSTIIVEEYDGYVYTYDSIESMVEEFRKALEKWLGEKQENGNGKGVTLLFEVLHRVPHRPGGRS